MNRTAGASVWVKTSGAGKTGWIPTVADTGWVDLVRWDAAGVYQVGGPLPSDITPNGAGYFRVRRIGERIEFQGSGYTVATQTTGSTNRRIFFPAWARPTARTANAASGDGGPSWLQLEIAFAAINSGRSLHGYYADQGSWITDTPWPAAL